MAQPVATEFAAALSYWITRLLVEESALLPLRGEAMRLKGLAPVSTCETLPRSGKGANQVDFGDLSGVFLLFAFVAVAACLCSAGKGGGELVVPERAALSGFWGPPARRPSAGGGGGAAAPREPPLAAAAPNAASLMALGGPRSRE